MPYFGSQHVDILLGEEKMAEIEQLEIGLEEFLRDFVVQRLVRVMAFLEEAADGGGDVSGVRFRLDRRDRERGGQNDERAGQKESGKVASFGKRGFGKSQNPCRRQENHAA